MDDLLPAVASGPLSYAVSLYDASSANKYKSLAYAARTKSVPYSAAVGDLCSKGAAKNAKARAPNSSLLTVH
jgi:hypothetical protein